MLCTKSLILDVKSHKANISINSPQPRHTTNNGLGLWKSFEYNTLFPVSRSKWRTSRAETSFSKAWNRHPVSDLSEVVQRDAEVEQLSSLQRLQLPKNTRTIMDLKCTSYCSVSPCHPDIFSGKAWKLCWISKPEESLTPNLATSRWGR